MSIAATATSQVAIDGAGEVEFAGNGEDSRNGAMGKRLDAKRIGGLKANEQVIGLAEVGKNEKPRLAVHTAGLDDALVGVAANVDSLEAGLG
jgi:hypothetical protein